MKDFLHNRPRVASAGSAAKTAAPAEPLFDAALLGAMPSVGPGHAHEASVEAIKEGDRVTKLIVTCRCGEKIEILCAYAPGQR